MSSRNEDFLKVLAEIQGRPLAYRLEGRTPVPIPEPVTDLGQRQRHQLIRELGFDPWRVAWDELDDNTVLSTVFTPMDYNFFVGQPLVFETMVNHDFKGGDHHWQLCDRYSTWDEAAQGHAWWLEKLQAGWRPGLGETP